MSKTDVTKLRELADSLGIDGHDYSRCVDLCRRVANEMELANARIDSLLDGLQKAQTALAESTAEIGRLRKILCDLKRGCDHEMIDEEQGPSETCCRMWQRIEQSAEAAGGEE